jgi:STE24 endopeptidase
MFRRLLVIAAVCIAAGAAIACAAQSPPPQAKPETKPEVKTYTLPPDKLAKAIQYAAARNRLHFISVAYGILVLIGLLAWHVAPRFRNWAEAASRRRIVQAYIFAPLLLLTIDLLELPVSAYGHHLSLEYDQSIQPWGSWLWDWSKGELISFVLAGVLIWILYGAMRRSPRRWWFYFWLAAVPIVVFLMFIEPVVIEPLFFKFEPLAQKQPALVADIEKVVARGGLDIPPDRMFEMKASEKLKSLNAYVAGIGASKRVVVWDNTIQKMNTGETLFVFGHEMGHYVLGHIWIGILAASGGILVFLLLAYYTMRWALARWGKPWEIREITDWASLPVLLLALAVFGFLSEPVSNSFSRVLEHNADVYGLEVIYGIVPDSSQQAAQAFQILGEISLDDPHPGKFIEFWLYDHPSISERVRFASQYDPWGTGGAPKYVK